MSVSRLFLEITNHRGSKLYMVTPIDPHPGMAARAWRLRQGKKVYDVAQDDKGLVTCTCADATYRDHLCKHAKALFARGLLTPKGK